MFANEGVHQLAHFHAEYAEHHASLAFDGTLIVGSFQRRSFVSFAAGRPYTRPSSSPTGNGSARVNGWRQSTRLPKIVDMSANPPWVMKGVAVIGDHKLRLLFEDGTAGDVSFEDREWTGIFEPLRDPARFAKVTIEYGTLCWPDEGLDWAPEPLYEATKANSLKPAAAAWRKSRAFAGTCPRMSPDVRRNRSGQAK